MYLCLHSDIIAEEQMVVHKSKLIDWLIYVELAPVCSSNNNYMW